MTRFGPRVLSAGTRAHYRDPAYYDRNYRSRTADRSFYADLAEDDGGPVLELGVGTARVALAMAERGVNVVGIDPMPPMLERGHERLAKASKAVQQRVELRRGDLRTLRLRRRFSLVVAAFNVFMHLYDRADWERALRTVQYHLSPGGLLAFDVRMPDPRELARDPARVYRGRPVTLTTRDGAKIRCRHGEAFDYDPVRQVQLVTTIFEPEAGETFVEPLAHRQMFPAELEALLHYNGFSLVAVFGDFDRGPLDERSESQIVLAEPAHKRRQR